MPSFPINSFKFGLDTRRDVLTSLPGTLVTCENCHINPGGEVEKRKQFDDIAANIDVLDSPNGATGTFGLEETSVGKVVFGSARDFDDVYVSATGVASVAIKGSGTGATFDITANTFGAITAAAVNAGGTGYVVGDILTLTTARGTEARLTVATLAGSAVATVTITNNGNEQAEPFLASALVGVTYQQLKHPSLVNDTTEDYVAGNHRMTACVFSENFNGKAFACAQFDDDRRFLYYDGVLVQHSANGIVMEGRTSKTDLSNDLLRQVRAVEYTGYANRIKVLLTSLTNVTTTATATYNDHGLENGDLVEVTGATQTAYNGLFIVFGKTANTFQYTMASDPGGTATGTPTATVLESGATLVRSRISDFFSALPEETANAGQFGFKNIGENGSGIAGLRATACFQITGFTGTFTLTVPEDSDGTGIADLCDGAVSGKSTATETATAIAAAVNNLTYVHGYSASSNGVNVFVYSALAWGAFTFSLTVTYTSGTVIACGVNPNTLAARCNPPIVERPLQLVPAGTGINGTYTTSEGVIEVEGGVAPFLFSFTESPAGSGNEFTINRVADTGRFRATKYIVIPSVTQATFVTGRFICTVTDSTPGTPLTAIAQVVVRASFGIPH